MRQTRKWTMWLILFGSAYILVLLFATVGQTFLWVYEEDSVEGSVISMGGLELAIGQPVLPLQGSGQYDFSITSNSTIDFYMRMGYTVLCRNENGEDLPVHIPENLLSIAVNQVTVDGSPIPLSGNAVQVVDAGGFEKNMISFISPYYSSDRYIPFPAGLDVAITGSLDIAIDADQFQQVTKEGALYLVLIPEGIQATGDAVQSLQAYGWDTGATGLAL